MQLIKSKPLPVLVPRRDAASSHGVLQLREKPFTWIHGWSQGRAAAGGPDGPDWASASGVGAGLGAHRRRSRAQSVRRGTLGRCSERHTAG